MTSQIRRSAVSITSNLAEGYGRNSTQDYVRFLRIAAGSLYELQTQIDISLNLGYLKKSDYDKIFESTRELSECFAA
ncbi:MAG TPA: four helix bundle protein [archaeon]|nr:four helix bundle protein [archaeon]